MSEDFKDHKSFNQKFLKKGINDKKNQKKQDREKIQMDEKESGMELESESDKESVVEDIESFTKTNKNKSTVKTILKTQSDSDSDSESNMDTLEIFGKKHVINKKPNITVPDTNVMNQFDLNNNFDFLNAEQEFHLEMENQIYIKKIMRKKKANKFDTVIIGLDMSDVAKINTLLSKIKTKFGIGGCRKEIEDHDTNKICEVLVLNGDYIEKIKDFLVKELNISASSVIIR
jgi:TusA-related sulfurtransferase